MSSIVAPRQPRSSDFRYFQYAIRSHPPCFDFVLLAFFFAVWLTTLVFVFRVGTDALNSLLTGRIHLSSSNGIAVSIGFMLGGFWLLLGARSAITLLWWIFGAEIIEANGLYLTISRRLWVVHRERMYEIQRIRHMKVLASPHDPTSGFATPLWNLSTGWITFAYHRKHHYFGLMMTEAEAKVLVKKLKQHFPELY